MPTHLVLTTSEPARRAEIAPSGSQISVVSSRFRRGPIVWRTAGVALGVLFATACGSSLQSNLPDSGNTGTPAGQDGGAADAPIDMTPDAATCADLSQAYDTQVRQAQECTLGASNQCATQVRASFFCSCTTFVNGSTDALTAIANQYQAAGCRGVCNGVCVQEQTLQCLADSTSSTGGRCQPPALLNLSADNNGGTFSVPVGYEVDIVLQTIGPDGYGTDVLLSSDAATVLEVTIAAGPQNPGGPRRLYRLGALSAGQVVVQIPYVEVSRDASIPAYTITLNIN